MHGELLGRLERCLAGGEPPHGARGVLASFFFFTDV